jgi:hypothetical protein
MRGPVRNETGAPYPFLLIKLADPTESRREAKKFLVSSGLCGFAALA